MKMQENRKKDVVHVVKNAITKFTEYLYNTILLMNAFISRYVL